VLRSSVVAERASVRSVSVICSGFLGEAKAIAKLSGMSQIALAEYTGHVSMDTDEDLKSKVRMELVDRVIAGLLGSSIGE
jgi:hypothetical protein